VQQFVLIFFDNKTLSVRDFPYGLMGGEYLLSKVEAEDDSSGAEADILRKGESEFPYLKCEVFIEKELRFVTKSLPIIFQSFDYILNQALINN